MSTDLYAAIFPIHHPAPVRACGWARTQTVGAAARRAGNITLARTLEEVA